MNPVRTDPTPEDDYRSPYGYRWELTHPDTEQWDRVEPLQRGFLLNNLNRPHD